MSEDDSTKELAKAVATLGESLAGEVREMRAEVSKTMSEHSQTLALIQQRLTAVEEDVREHETIVSKGPHAIATCMTVVEASSSANKNYKAEIIALLGITIAVVTLVLRLLGK